MMIGKCGPCERPSWKVSLSRGAFSLPRFPVHVAVEEHGQAVGKLSNATLHAGSGGVLLAAQPGRRSPADLGRGGRAIREVARAERTFSPLYRPMPQDRRGLGEGVSGPNAARPA